MIIIEQFIGDYKAKKKKEVEKSVIREHGMSQRTGEKLKVYNKRLDEYKKTDKYLNRVQEILNEDPLYVSCIGETPTADPVVLKAYADYVAEKEKEERRIAKEKEEQRINKFAKKYVQQKKQIFVNYAIENSALMGVFVQDTIEEFKNEIEKHLMNDEVCVDVEVEDRYGYHVNYYFDEEELNENNILECLEPGDDIYCEKCRVLDTLYMNYECIIDETDFCEKYLKYAEKYDQEDFEKMLSALLDEADVSYHETILSHLSEVFNREIKEHYSKYFYGMVDDIIDSFSDEQVKWLISCNPRYSGILKEAEDKVRLEKEREERIKNGILDRIPENPIDLFPLARKMKRHFILHIGPTNSGKTHDALAALKSAKTGAYFAPLRLLAAECADQLNQDGIPCDLVTGEEIRLVKGANHRASTVELMNPTEELDVAVIDEAQLLFDDQRGWAWTFAILGTRAKEIHVCTAPEAENILVKLISSCNDTYEIIDHRREVPLNVDDKKFSFPKDVEDSDALIVFSKRNVLAVAAELKENNVPCSVIYGSLPYEVRKNEVDRFLKGETKVVVATDAIGMGMNLPIRRVVFLEMKKFDGKENRSLKPAEILQIAGRAGRKGMFEEGYFTSEYSNRVLKEALKSKTDDINKAYLGFPEVLTSVEGNLSEVMEHWIAMQDSGIFKKTNLEIQLRLCKELEAHTKNKKLIYSFITIPFDEKNEELHDIWKSAFLKENGGSHLSFTEPDIISDIRNFDQDEDGDDDELLDKLENAYKYCDLMYFYRNRFVPSETDVLDKILSCKREISNVIIKILETKGYSKRKCRECGRPLPWNYPYPMCQHCHDELYPSRRNYYDWDDGDDYDYDDIF